MIGIDTTWLIDLDVQESPRHAAALQLFNSWKSQPHKKLAIYHHVFLEYQHVITDSRRFEYPLTMAQAIKRVWFWTEQERISVIYPTEASHKRAQLWLSAYKLARNRLSDTHMAAAYTMAGVSQLISANAQDFALFDAFTLLSY